MLDRAAGVFRALCRHVSGVRSIWRREHAEVVVGAVNVDPRHPAGLAPGDAHKAVRIVSVRASLILLVDVLRNIAQVVYLVVARVAVSVVKLAFGPLAMHVQPSKTVGAVVVTVYSDLDVAAAIHAASERLIGRLAAWIEPTEMTSSGVVAEKFAQTRGGKIGGSHGAVPSQSGQRPACVSSTSGPRYFSCPPAKEWDRAAQMPTTTRSETTCLNT